MNKFDSFLLFSINENKWQLFLALDFSCLKEVEGITTNPFNQNIFFCEETQFDSKGDDQLSDIWHQPDGN